MDTHLRPYFSSNATQMDVDAFLFQKAVEAADPSVAKKLFVDMAIPAIRICRPWYVARARARARLPLWLAVSSCWLSGSPRSIRPVPWVTRAMAAIRSRSIGRLLRGAKSVTRRSF